MLDYSRREKWASPTFLLVKVPAQLQPITISISSELEQAL